MIATIRKAGEFVVVMATVATGMALVAGPMMYDPTTLSRKIASDVCARTVYGEMRGEGEEARAAVVHVAYNRLSSGRWGKNMTEVFKTDRQFSAWNRDDPNYPFISDPALEDDALYPALFELCSEEIKAREAGEPDPTGGCDHYWTGKRTPRWAVGLEKLARRIGPMKCIKLTASLRAKNARALAAEPKKKKLPA